MRKTMIQDMTRNLLQILLDTNIYMRIDEILYKAMFNY
jgi:hypothetical protein